MTLAHLRSAAVTLLAAALIMPSATAIGRQYRLVPAAKAISRINAAWEVRENKADAEFPARITLESKPLPLVRVLLQSRPDLLANLHHPWLVAPDRLRIWGPFRILSKQDNGKIQASVGQTVPAETILRLSTLTSISLEQHFIQTAPESLSDYGFLDQMRSLRDVQLGARDLSDADVDVLVQLPALERVTLVSDSLTERAWDFLSRSPRLESIDVRYTSIGAPRERHFSCWPKLKELWLPEEEELSEEDLAALDQRANGIRNVCCGRITDRTLQRLARWPNLNSLTIKNGNCVTAEGYRALSQNPALQTFSLESGAISAESLRYLNLLPRLDGCGIPPAALTDENFQEWTAIQRRCSQVSRW